MPDAILSPAELEAAGLAGWQPIGTDPDALGARFRTGDFATGLRLVVAIGDAAEAADHHPDVDLRYGHVDVRLWSHDAGGITARDVALARRTSELAAELGVAAEPPA